MLFTVSAQASFFVGLSNIGSKKIITVSGFDQNALINLIICKIVSSWLGLSIPDHEVTPKNRATTYLLYYYCFCSVEKNHHLHRRWINPFPQLLASHNLKMNLDVINSIQDISRKLKVGYNNVQIIFRDPSGFWNPGK